MDVEKLKSILKQLEGVYKVTTNAGQKKRVKEEIEKIRKQIEDVNKYGVEEVLTETDDEIEHKKVVVYEEDSPDKFIEKSKTLSKFPVQTIHPLIRDYEIRHAISYVQSFEDELWGALSDFHLKLDFFHSREREKFYNKLENVKRLIKQYVDVLNELSNISNDNYGEKLKLMKNKQERAILIESVKFMNEVNIFLDKIVRDYDNKGNILLNPADKINFSTIEGQRLLNNWAMIDALRFINDFCVEFIEIIQLPDEILNIKNNEF